MVGISLVLMNKKVLLCKKTNNINSEGFFRTNVETLAKQRVFVEAHCMKMEFVKDKNKVYNCMEFGIDSFIDI